MQSKTPTAKHKFEGHEGKIYSFVFLHDNVHVVSGSLDGTMRKWDCETGSLIGEPWKGEGGGIPALALSPDGKTIACGRMDGSVQKWGTNGKMMKSIWTGHSDWVRSLSWSPSGGHIASGSDDGTILIREAESGKVEVGPIKTKQDWVYSLAYSPLGDRIASGGFNNTICTWDSNTGELLVGPIKDLGNTVTSVAWSLDGSKLYSASDEFARVFDSVSGTLLHRFQHDSYLSSVALSPKHNVLACVGGDGIAQLWDTESHKPLGQPFYQEDRKVLYCVSFSSDEQYLAYGGEDNKITLWTVQDIAPQITVHAPMSKIQDITQEETQPEPPSSSSLNGDDIMEEDRNDPYDNFFTSSQSSLTSAPCDPSRKRRLQNIFSNLFVLRPPVNQSMGLRDRLKHPFRVHAPANSNQGGRTPEGRVEGGGEGHGKDVDLHPCSANITPCTVKGKRREELPDDNFPPAAFDSNYNRKFQTSLMGPRGKGTACGKNSPAKITCSPSPKVTKAHTNSISNAGSYSHASPVHTHTSSQAISGQSSEPSSPPAAYGHSHPSSTRHVWNTLIWFRRHPPPNESIPPQPRPITVYAARPRKFYWKAPRKVHPIDQKPDAGDGHGAANAQTAQSTSTAVQPSTGGPQRPQTQSPSLEEEYDFRSIWENFWMALLCFRRPAASTAMPTAS